MGEVGDEVSVFFIRVGHARELRFDWGDPGRPMEA